MKHERVDILATALLKYGRPMQMDMMIEEMSDLTKAMMKYRRNGHNRATVCKINEEMADVQVMLDHMKIMFGDTDGEEAKKIRRLAERLGMGSEKRGG